MWKKLALFISILLVLWTLNQGSVAFGAGGSLLGRWMCDEGQGSVVSDSSGNKRNGKFVNGDPAWTPGHAGSAIKLVDPTLVEVPSINMTLSEATMAGWLFADGLQPQWSAIIMHRGSGTAHGFNMYDDGRLVYHWNDDAATYNYRGTAYYVANEWTHCALTIQPTKATFYVNGVEASVNAIRHNPANWSQPFHLGGDNNAFSPSRRMKGALDDVMMFSRALSAEQVAGIMNGTLPVFLKAEKPNPADGTVDVTLVYLQWTPGEKSMWEDVYLGTTPELTAANRVSQQLAARKLYIQVVPPLEPGQKYYWRVDSLDGAKKLLATGDVWSFTAQALKASIPSPADGATGQFPGITLGWLRGSDTQSNRVYLGFDKTAVANGDPSADKGSVTEASFSTGALRSSTTYYWRVDTVNTDTTVVPGDVWSFSTMDAGPENKIVYQLWSNIGGTAVSVLTGDPRYPSSPDSVEYLDSWLHPVNAAPDADWGSNYGDRIYGWLKPPATADYTFWVAGDDETQLLLSTDASPANAVMVANVSGWTPALDFDNTGGGSGGASQKSAPINLKAGQKYFIMTLHKEGGGGDSVAVAWQGGPITAREVIKAEYVDTFSLPPLQAYRPRPANGAVDTVQTLTLTWSAGEKAQQHAVYLGDDANAVGSADASSPLFKGQRADASFDTGELEWGKTYYWRVDEINTGEAGSPWKGSVWSFTTANYIPIDDFESYTDEEVGRIFQSWIDGWGYTTPEPGNLGNGTGSTVGYTDPPFAETKVIHNGRQSMPFEYNNIDSSFIKPYYSETERTWTAAQDWTSHGMNTLSLWFRGYPISFVDKGNEAFTVSASGSDIYGTADNFRFVYKRLSGDGSIMAKVESLGNVYEYAKAGVMIRTGLAAGSMYAIAAVSPSHGTTFEFRQMDDSAAGSSGAWLNPVVKAPYWVRLTRTANVFKAEISPDAKTWTSVGTDQTILMGNSSIYIGLCVTSHDVAVPTTAEFSGVATTGGVSGSWQPVWIGADPDLTNSPANLYVAVQDSTKKIAVVSQSDLNAVLTTDWTEWQIPLSSFSGVSMNKITKMFIGVGNRDNPAADGHGKLYIDDIRVIKP